MKDHRLDGLFKLEYLRLFVQINLMLQHDRDLIFQEI